MHDGDATHFINVDLELVARTDLAPLLAELAPATVTLRDSVDNGQRTLWLELGGDPRDANDAVTQFVASVRALPAAARSAWDACDDRCLNIGIQGGRTPHAEAFRLSVESVAGMAEITARLEFTVYGGESGSNP